MNSTANENQAHEGEPSRLEVALSLAEHAGWYVFPCQADKRPQQGIKWLEAATTDAEQIRRWWQRWPDARIGYHAGRSRLLVVDVDVAKGDDGRDGRANLRAAGLRLPNTLTYRTPSGGQHHVYRAPEGVELTVAKDAPVPGVDIRAGNGYAIYYGPALTEALR